MKHGKGVKYIQLGVPLQGCYLWATGTHDWQSHLKNWSLQGGICQGDSWPRKLYCFVDDCPLFFFFFYLLLTTSPLLCFPCEVHRSEGMDKPHAWQILKQPCLVLEAEMAYLAFTSSRLQLLPRVDTHCWFCVFQALEWELVHLKSCDCDCT